MAYVITARLGFMFAMIHGSVTLVWFPSGLALAAMMLWGRRLLPGVAIGAFLANFLPGNPWPFPLATAIGNPAEALIGMMLLCRLGFRPSLDRVRDVLCLALLAAPVGAMVAATIGATTLWGIHEITAAMYGRVWLHWFLGDTTGMIVVAPVIFTVAVQGVAKPPRWPRVVEGLVLLTALTAFGLLFFGARFAVWPDLLILLIPLLMLVAFCFSPREVALINLLTAGAAAIGAQLTLGPAGSALLSQKLLALSLLLLTTNLTAQLLAAEMAERRQSDDALRRSEEFNRRLLNSSVDCIKVLDLQADLLSMNEGGRCLMEIEDVGPYLNKSYLNFWNEEDRPKVAQALVAARTGNEGHFEGYSPSVKGTPRWWDVRITPIRGAGGQPERLLVIGRDITEQKWAEQALERERVFLRQVIDVAPSMIFVKNWEGRFVLANEALAHCYDTTIQEVVGKTDIDFNPHIDELEHFTHDDRQVMSTRQEKRIPEEKVSFANGEVHWFSTIKVPLINPDGTCDKVLGAASDITERKRMEGALRTANTQLAEADRRKDEFLAMLAHELRNPLAPIRNALQILRHTGLEGQVIQRQHGIIDRQVSHMARLLDDLLDVSRITSGKIVLQKQTLRLSDVLTHAIETATPLIEARHHTLHLSWPPESLRVEGDIDRLAQAVGNLLANAAKYTDEGGQIWLEAEAEDHLALVRVRDNGAGISTEMLPFIFDLFAQADRSLGRAQGGLGIGLTMVKTLVEMHGGTVEARSEGFGRGSEFTVYLPAQPLEADAPAQPAKPGRPAHAAPPRRILVVDDLEDTSASLAELLEIWGHEVRTAHDGPAALELARACRPEVVLFDIGMPGMDGFEVARLLRAEYGDKMLLIALTGYAQESDRQQCRQAGFDHHLAKPIDLEALREHLAQVPLGT